MVVGPSCAGKSTLGAELARRLNVPFIELDALFWRPGWQRPPDDEFCRLLVGAHSGEAWVSAGNYLRQARQVTWPAADTLVWLDVPLPVTTWRVLRRSWRRWRSRELLWGTCRESFWRQLCLWSQHRSLITYNMVRHRANRRVFERAFDEWQSAGRRCLRLRSSRDIARLLAAISAP
ncbi:shikimate kinase [Tepidiforma sp.]|uniref:shikimate kinase n=1 Tax=Tepidiforma sp. TaxID=2682230 RepID=UPI002ADDEB20|nr:shikimate kinase [Tepidiforma sp.]